MRWPSNPRQQKLVYKLDGSEGGGGGIKSATCPDELRAKRMAARPAKGGAVRGHLNRWGRITVGVMEHATRANCLAWQRHPPRSASTSRMAKPPQCGGSKVTALALRLPISTLCAVGKNSAAHYSPSRLGRFAQAAHRRRGLHQVVVVHNVELDLGVHLLLGLPELCLGSWADALPSCMSGRALARTPSSLLR